MRNKNNQCACTAKSKNEQCKFQGKRTIKGVQMCGRHMALFLKKGTVDVFPSYVLRRVGK